MKTRQAGILFIFITLFLDILGIGLVVPLLPQLVTHFFEGDLSQGSKYFGILLGSYAFMQFIFAPILGSLSDRYGRRPILLIATFGSGLDYLLMALAPTFSWLLIARIISGITGSSITVGTAYIADISTPEKRAQNFGLLGAAFGLGFIFGPAIGGLLGSIHISYPFYAAAFMTLLNFIYGYFVLPESLEPALRQPFSLKKANPMGAFKMLGRSKGLIYLSIVFLLANLAQQGVQSTWVLFTSYQFHWGELQNGMSLAAVGFFSALVQGGLIRKLMPRWGEQKAILIGLGIGVITMILYGLAPQGWMLYPIIALNSLAGIAGPAAQGLISNQVSPGEQGALQGSLASLGTVTRIIGPLMATSLFSQFTAQSSPYQVPGIAFFASALLMAFALGFSYWLFRGKHLPKTPLESP